MNEYCFCYSGSLSESDDPSIELEPRISRSKAKTHERNYESTQSVDRNGNNEKRSVFYLDPLDWIRTEARTVNKEGQV